MFSLGVEVGRIGPLAIVVFGGNLVVHALGSLHVLGEGDGVGDIEVKVVLELFQSVHPFHNVGELSNSLEGE